MRNIFGLTNLVSWLETKDPEALYKYADAKKCVIAQYFTEHGVKFTAIYAFNWLSEDGSLNQLPEGFSAVAYATTVHKGGYRTFGNALAMARKLLARESNQTSEELSRQAIDAFIIETLEPQEVDA